MRPVRFVALGDSLTQGVGDPAGDGWRGWAALLAPSLAETADAVKFTNLAVSGAQTRDVLERQTPAALELRPDLVSVVIGVNDTLRHTFDIQAVAAHLDEVYATFAREGAALLTACLPDPGAMLGLPGALARPLARRQRAVNTIVHALSERYGAVHLHAADGAWITDRALWSADRLHPGERGHRQLAVRFHALLTEAGRATGQPPSPEPEFPAPTKAASLLWLATAGTAWVARRCKDLLPQLLRLAADELHHRARGTTTRLDLSASAAVSAALASLANPTTEDAEAQRRPAGAGPTGLAGAGRAASSGGGAACESAAPGAVRVASSAGGARSGGSIPGTARAASAAGAAAGVTVPSAAPVASVGTAVAEVTIPGAVRASSVGGAASGSAMPGTAHAVAGAACGGAVPGTARVASAGGAASAATIPGAVRAASSGAAAVSGGAILGNARAASVAVADLEATGPDTAGPAGVPDAACAAVGTQAARTTPVVTG